MRRNLPWTLGIVLLAGCASGAWRWDGQIATAPGLVPDLPSHRTVERITLEIAGHELEMVGYRACDPDRRTVRAQLVLVSGLSVLDAAVRGDEDRVLATGALDAVPRFAQTALADLRRVWGSRSLFAVTSDDSVPRGTERAVTDGRTRLPALRVADGSWLAVARLPPSQGGGFEVTLLSAGLVPEARIEYRDFDEDGVPRDVRRADLSGKGSLRAEVEEVRLVERAVPEATFTGGTPSR